MRPKHSRNQIWCSLGRRGALRWSPLSLLFTLFALLQRKSCSGATSLYLMRRICYSFLPHTFVYRYNKLITKSASSSNKLILWIHYLLSVELMGSIMWMLMGSAALWIEGRAGGHTSTMSLFGLSNFTNPSTITHLPAKENTDICWKECATPKALRLNTPTPSMTTIMNSAVYWLFWNPLFFCEYKKYFCDQINIIHTALNHKTNAVC